MKHIAILKRPYLNALLDGRKTIECRLLKMRIQPFGVVKPGDTVYFKESGGPYRGIAKVARVAHLANLTPLMVRLLRRSYNDRILGTPEFWRDKRGAKHATLIWFAAMRPFAGRDPARVLPPRRAWHVLPRVTTRR